MFAISHNCQESLER